MNTTAYNQFAKEIANYINYHCDGVDEGFEIEYEGFTAFVSYKAEIREQPHCFPAVLLIHHC